MAVYDDYPAVVRAIRLMLLRLGHEVVEDFFDGADLALVDMHMGPVNGLDVIRSIRKFRPECRVIAISGAFDAGDQYSEALARQALEAGAERCLGKPLDLADLEAALQPAS